MVLPCAPANVLWLASAVGFDDGAARRHVVDVPLGLELDRIAEALQEIACLGADPAATVAVLSAPVNHDEGDTVQRADIRLRLNAQVLQVAVGSTQGILEPAEAIGPGVLCLNGCRYTCSMQWSLARSGIDETENHVTRSRPAPDVMSRHFSIDENRQRRPHVAAILLLLDSARRIIQLGSMTYEAFLQSIIGATDRRAAFRTSVPTVWSACVRMIPEVLLPDMAVFALGPRRGATDCCHAREEGAFQPVKHGGGNAGFVGFIGLSRPAPRPGAALPPPLPRAPSSQHRCRPCPAGKRDPA